MRSTSPPPFLLAAALLFWSAMSGQWLIGLSLAAIVELAHWVRVRWDFNDAAFLRAWHLSVLLIAARMVLTFFEGSRTELIQQLVLWAPALFFPIQFTQSYGMRDKMPLYTFSILARKRWERNRKMGIGGRPVEIPFGYVYLGATLLAASLGKEDAAQSMSLFLGGFILLLAWAMLALGRRMVVLVCLAFVGLIAAGGMVGLKSLYKLAISGGGTGSNDGLESITAIGSLGRLKQSNDIIWRIRTLQGPTPPLLHTATYNQYYRGTWSCRLPSENSQSGRDFEIVNSNEPEPGQVYYYASAPLDAKAISADLPRISLRGAAREKMMLPVPGSLTSLTGFDFDYVQRNPLSTFRVEPKDPIIHGIEIWDPTTSPDALPVQTVDVKVPDEERAAVHATAERLGLSTRTHAEQLAAVKDLFAREFRYTRYLSISAPRLNEAITKGPTALNQFLTTNKEGHCEYFATAATLLLRDAGVPVRYVVGFAVKEVDPGRKEAVLRGIHAHAWCRVWDEDKKIWEDFDPTPADWLMREPDRSGWNQWITDWIQRIREDFFIWRNDPGNTTLIGLIMGFFGLAGAAAIGRNLWSSRRRIEKGASSKALPPPAVRTPLHGLEPLARKLLGPRPPGVPYARWLLGLHAVAPTLASLDEAIALHQKHRFDPEAALTADSNDRLARLEREIRDALKARRKFSR